MTIVHVNIGLGGGGAEHMILEMAKKSQLDQIDTIVLAMTNNDQIEYKFAENNLNYHYLGITSPKGFFRGIKKMKQVDLSKYQNTLSRKNQIARFWVGFVDSICLGSWDWVSFVHINC